MGGRPPYEAVQHYNVSKLADRTADRIRGRSIGPNLVVDTVLSENGVGEEHFLAIRHEVLSELAKRSASARRAKKKRDLEKMKDVFQDLAELALADEMVERAHETHEDTHPVND